MNKLERAITKWTRACDKRLARLISYIHFTFEYKHNCHVRITAQQCRLGLFQGSDFAGDLEDSKSTPGGTLCVFGTHTFVPIIWMCKKQTCVSHSSTESEIFLWLQVYEWTEFPRLISGIWLLCCIQTQVKNRNFKQARSDPSYSKASEKRVNSQCNTQVSQRHLELWNVDFVSSNVNSSLKGAILYIF